MATFAGDSGPRVIHAAALSLDWEPVAPPQAVSGDARVGTAEVTRAAGIEVGVWSHSPGVSTDTEADEVFVVLAGRASIEISDGTVLDVGPGASGSCLPGRRPRGPSTRSCARPTSSGTGPEDAARRGGCGWVSARLGTGLRSLRCSRGYGRTPPGCQPT